MHSLCGSVLICLLLIIFAFSVRFYLIKTKKDMVNVKMAKSVGSMSNTTKNKGGQSECIEKVQSDEQNKVENGENDDDAEWEYYYEEENDGDLDGLPELKDTPKD